jgi:hypothetical protein
MAKLKVTKDGFEAEADLRIASEAAFKRLPEKIYEWWTNRRNKKFVEKAISNIRNLAFKPWKKYWKKFRIYENFSLPKSIEQIKSQSAYDFEHRYELGHLKEFENRLEKEYAHHELIRKFQEENGGNNSFGVYLERGLKLNGFTMLPFRKVYTFSKKGKAVCVLEEFRPIDNSYNIFVYCTKNWV